jgi:hypothetical protein
LSIWIPRFLLDPRPFSLKDFVSFSSFFAINYHVNHTKRHVSIIICTKRSYFEEKGAF